MQQDVQGACRNCRMRKRTNSSTRTSPTKGPTSSLKVTKRTRIDLIHLGGGIMFPRQCILPLPLRHPGGKSQTAGARGTGQLHHGVKSDFFSFLMKHFACQKFNLLAIDRRCKKYTHRAHVFLMRSLSAFLSLSLVAVCSPGSSHLVRLIPRTHAWLKHKMKLGTLCHAQKCSRHRAPCHESVTSLAHGLLPSQ